ncbi:MAG: biliverdin-producing heme oxygenase [Propionibacteriaceae bacterium]|nr:biliverdin-producing heme oxygenase [Propionibacteriaceae bacterium]
MTALFTELSTQMREGSQAEHTAAETSSFMAALLAGEVNEAGYTAYLARLRPVYQALESTDWAGHPVAGALIDPALERLAALDEDLSFWAPDGLPAIHSPAAGAYAARIESAGAPGYVAHHYTRYLGDLSGGQAIGRILDRSFGLDGQGLAFYRFDAIPKPKPYKDAYRARLDALPLSPAERAEVVTEVRVAFKLNQALFEELGRDLDRFARTAV